MPHHGITSFEGGGRVTELKTRPLPPFTYDFSGFIPAYNEEKNIERVLEELAAIAFANGTDFATITHNGLVRLTPTDEVPEEKKKAVASIKEGQYGTEIKLHDKVRALELLGKHLGVFDANNSSGNEQENNIFEVIEESTREEIGTDEIPEIEPPAKPGHDLVE